MLGLAQPVHLKLLYLTHLELAAQLASPERDRVLRTLLRCIFHEEARPRRVHAVCFSAAEGCMLRGFVRRTTPGTVYEVLPEGTRGSALLDAAVSAGSFPLELAVS